MASLPVHGSQWLFSRRLQMLAGGGVPQLPIGWAFGATVVRRRLGACPVGSVASFKITPGSRHVRRGGAGIDRGTYAATGLITCLTTKVGLP